MADILVICSRTPYPLTGGAKLRLFHTAALLSEHHEVDLLIVDENDVTDERFAALDKQFRDVFSFTYPSHRFTLGTIPGIVSRRPFQTHYFEFRDVHQWLNHNASRYDLLFCNHVRTTEYARDRDIPKVVDLVDAISRNYAKSGTRATGPWRVIYPIESRRLRRYERTVVSEFDHSFIITESDKQYIEGDTRTLDSLSVVPNGVRAKLLETNHIDQRDPTIVFLGKMDYPPNVDAVEYFVDEVFPAVKGDTPDVKFTVVGTNPTASVRSLAEEPNIEVTGFVEDPVEYLARATVVVAPMRLGAGLQNKVLEAMALGKPVVTTPLGREGIDASDGVHLRVAAGSDAFASAVTDLLTDPEQRKTLGENARNLISKRYTWSSIKPRLLGPVESVLEQTQ